MYQICTLPSIHVHAYDGKCKMFTLYNCTFYNLKRRSFKEDLQQCTHLILQKVGVLDMYYGTTPSFPIPKSLIIIHA